MVLTELYEPEESSLSKFEIFTYKVSLGHQEKRSCFGIHRGEKIREKNIACRAQLWNCAIQEKISLSLIFSPLSSPNLQIQQLLGESLALIQTRVGYVCVFGGGGVFCGGGREHHFHVIFIVTV